MLEEYSELFKKADLFIEIGTKIKELVQKPYMDKTEDELTEEELKEYHEFIGLILLKIMEINK